MFGTYNRLNVHVHASDRQVIRIARSKLTKAARRDPAKRTARHAFYRTMLEHHRNSRDLFEHFRF